MTKKKAPGRDQKALVILGANLSTVEEQENELIVQNYVDSLIRDRSLVVVGSA